MDDNYNDEEEGFIETGRHAEGAAKYTFYYYLLACIFVTGQ